MELPKAIYLLTLLILLLNLTGCNNDNAYRSRLYTPTYITKIDNNYFIVDCWHHRIIYNSNLKDPIIHWKTLTDDIAGPHTIVSDGKILIAEDTGRHRLFVFKKAPTGSNRDYELTQILYGVGKRPHRVIYDNQTKLFYVIASTSQQIIAIKDDNGVAEIVYKKHLPFLNKAYTRDIGIIDNSMVFVSGPGKIIFTTFKDGNFDIIKEYAVPKEFFSMNDIVKFNNFYYITATPQKFVRVKSLDDFSKGKFEDLMDMVGFKGTPYFFSEIDGRIYLPQITQYSGIISFEIKNDKINDIIAVYDFGPPTDASTSRKKEFPE